jgi:beta-xylosidase
MKFEVRVKNDADKRKWLMIGKFDNRIDVVREVGFAISPKEVNEMKINTWYSFKKNTQVRIVK